MRTESERCSVRSERLREPLAATASTVPTWVLLEQPGPWGRFALTDSRLPEGVGRRLRTLSHDLGVRIVLIRRYGRVAPEEGSQAFLVGTGPGRPWMERLDLSEPVDLLDLELSPMAVGLPPGLGSAETEPVFVVCTHGRRDPCCAERGRPVAQALDGAFGSRAWESSHVGGDRFAANLVAFPHGAYFGRVDPSNAVAVARAYADGRLTLDHYRGRSCFPFAVQAAEIEVRKRLGLEEIDSLGEARWRTVGPGVLDVSIDRAAGATVVLRVRTVEADPARVLTCHGEEEVRPPAYVVEGFETLRTRPRP